MDLVELKNGYIKSLDDQYLEDNVEYVLATLLLNDVLIVNNFWWKTEWKKDQRDNIAIAVNCSDVFAYAAADAEIINYDEIIEVYKHWKQDYIWGPTVFCIKKRKCKPLPHIFSAIKKHNIWNLDFDYIDYV